MMLNKVFFNENILSVEEKRIIQIQIKAHYKKEMKENFSTKKYIKN